MPIRLDKLSSYSLLTISAMDGLPEIYYRGIEPTITISGFIYVYNSNLLKNHIGTYLYPTNDITILNSNSSTVTLLYIGTMPNTIMIVSRIPEFHANGCKEPNNILFLNSTPTYREITALDSGSCIFTIFVPYSSKKGFANLLIINNLEYDGALDVSLIGGYNTTFFEFNQ